VVPNVSDVYIGKVLRQLRDDGEIVLEKSGQKARWRRLADETTIVP
jgi:hypothetical protein